MARTIHTGKRRLDTDHEKPPDEKLVISDSVNKIEQEEPEVKLNKVAILKQIHVISDSEDINIHQTDNPLRECLICDKKK